jgi:signal transduction histidine kinase
MAGRLRARLHRHSVRVRLTALYGLLFLASGAGLLAVTYALVDHGSGRNVLTFSNSTSRQVIALLTQGKPPRGAGEQERSLHVSAPDARPLPQDAGRTVAAVKKLAAAQQADLLHRLLLDSGLALGVMAVVSCGLGWVVAGRALRPLESSLAAQRQFVANASHELRTPLARQRAIGQVALADPEADVASLRAAHERVLAAGAQQERLIAALLALARGQAGVHHLEELDLGEIAARVVAQRQGEADLRGVLVSTALSAAPLRGDPRLVESLVGNLVDNAVRHNEPDGWVDVSSALSEGRAVLTVTNSGPVVDPGEVARLLEPFHRHRAARTAGADGFGIGLSVVQAVCDAHRATLDVRARDRGGLAVTVGFAATVHRAEARTRPLRDIAVTGSTEPGKVGRRNASGVHGA